MAEDYSHEIKSYSDLTDASNGITNSVNSMSNDIKSADQIMSRLQNSDSFQGPIAEHISQMWGVISKTTQNNVSSLNNNASLINSMNNDYQEKDREVSSEVGER